MKNLRPVFLICFALFMSTQFQAQPCDKNISTNPDNPINMPFATAYPNLINPWLNTFDISAGQIAPPVAENIELNNNVIWQIPDWNQNIALEMFNPFTSSGTPYSRYNYLWSNNVPFSKSDFQWEDGWELLYLGTGYFPNGDEVNSQNSTSIYPSGTTTMENPKVPYIILYNRYRGTMRVFMNLFAPFGPYDNLRISLEFANQDKISGILRHLEPIDRPLDQTTNIGLIESFNPNSGGINRWFSADFQMGYDPCDCGQGKQIKFMINGIDTMSMSLYGRALATEIPLMDNGQPDYDNDWLSLHDITGGVSGGNRIYTKFDGLIDDYKADLTRYEQLSSAYADYQNRKDILDGIKDVVVDGVAGFVPGAGSLTSWFLKPKSEDPSATSSGLSYAKGNAKGLLGWGYDLLSTNIAKGVSEPTAPTMPVASYNEMRFAGTITSTSEPVVVGPFYIPGAFNESSLTGNLTAFNYPTYNASMGMVALLNTPSAKIEYAQQGSHTSIEDNGSGDGCIYDRDVFVKNNFELRVKLDEELNIALNKSLDFDMDRTESYGGIEVEIKVANNDFTEFNNFIGNTVNNSEQNMYVNLDYNVDGDRIIRLNSKWVPLELLNQYVFSLKRQDIYHFEEIFHEPPAGTTSCDELDPPNYSTFDYEYEIVSVKLKLIHDMYFDQIGSNGEQVNTTQVFSYFLYNADENINLFDSNPGSWDQFTSGEMDQYIPGTETLTSQTITPSSPMVMETIGNTMYIRAENVRITGDIDVQTGYNLIVEALSEIKSSPGTILNPNIHLRIRRDFYSQPIFEYADDNETGIFCQGNDYQANVASRRLKRSLVAAQNEQQSLPEPFDGNNITIHPNPANAQTWITSSSKPITEIEIFDLSGRSLIHQKPDGANLTRVSVDVGALQSGVYIVKARCEDESSSQKLMIGR